MRGTEIADEVLPVNTTTVEPKVKWQAIAGYVIGVVCLGLVAVLQNGPFLIDAIPAPLQVFILPFIPGVIGLLAGYSARHQWRAGEQEKNSLL